MVIDGIPVNQPGGAFDTILNWNVRFEFEHGAHDPETDVTGDDLNLTGKIAWAHLKEIRDYYTRLDRLEAEAEGVTLP